MWNLAVSVFDGQYPEVQIGPAASDQVGGVVPARGDIHRVGDQRIAGERGVIGRADDQDRKLPDDRKVRGVGNIELVAAGNGLLVGRDVLEADIFEDSVMAVEEHVEGRAAVSHVGYAVAAGIVA